MRSTILGWFSIWMSWCIAMLSIVYSEEDIIKDDDMIDWQSRMYILDLDSFGDSWRVDGDVVKTCGNGQKADFGLSTKHVNLKTTFAEVIYVDVEAELTISNCFNLKSVTVVQCYSSNFEVYIHPGKYGTDTFKNITLDKLDYSPLYNITNHTHPGAKLSKSSQTFSFNMQHDGRRNQTFSFPQSNSQDVGFAIRSRGACGTIFRMKMYYYYCKEISINGVKFEKTPSPANGFKNVTGNCPEYATPLTTANFDGYCYPNGNWSIPENNTLECFCVEGYTPNNTHRSCSSCSNTSYKKNISNNNCTECPTNTVSNMNRTSCVCKDGYYKSSSDNNELSPCYALPVISERPRTRRVAYSVELSWTTPNNSLNETILYNVRCFICNQSICNISCQNEAYDPSSKNLSQTRVTVSNLIAGEIYVFRVYARNSLNDAVPEDEWGYTETVRVEVTASAKKSTDDDNFIIYIIIGVIAAMLLILIILLIICVRRRKKNGVKKPTTHGYVNQGVELSSVGRGLYVDPSGNYDDPEAAVQEFASELDPKMIFLERMIGGGEFGDVYTGELTTTDKKIIPIVAKTLKHDANAKSENNPNIVRKEGVVTKSIPRMIILEFMSNGSLNNYLKDNIVEDEVNVDVKHHRHFVTRQGKVLTEIIEDFGGVSISFPRYGSGSERVVLKGASNCVEGAKERILEIVKDLESMTTIEVVIAQKHHRSLMGAKGATVQGVQNRCNVHIRFPERAAVNGTDNGDHPTMNGDSPTPPAENEDGVKKCDIIQITGKVEQVELAKQALLDLIPITETVKIPFDYHRYIIGTKGANIRAMMNEYDVNILIPPAKDESDDVTISGPRENVTQAINALNKRVDEIDAENEDKVGEVLG